MKDVIIKIFNTRKSRRGAVLDRMNELFSSGKSCINCTGVCCTSIANSMQIDSVQALDLYIYLIRKNMFQLDLLEQNIQDFRLQVLSLGKGKQTFRKHYTCPFYAGGNLGCTISPNSKPYGCLAFNPIGAGVSGGENCRSYIESLEQREEDHQDFEKGLNSLLEDDLGLINDTQPIPIKLLEVHYAMQTRPELMQALRSDLEKSKSLKE